MRALLREPLLHFLLLGVLLFLLFELRARPQPGADRIVVAAGQIAHLGAVFEGTWMRPPTAAELDDLVREHVREELACREALALGLERDDTIVRRRLRQKLEFVVEDLAAQHRPADAELALFLATHPESFRREPRFSFRHVYLSRERRGAALAEDARALLARLAAGGSEAEVSDLGDPGLLPSELELAAASEIDALFGEGFARGLEELADGCWGGPVPSSYGAHLVYVGAREEGGVPELDEVREEVEREWFAERRVVELERFYAELMERYEVVIEPEMVPGGAR